MRYLAEKGAFVLRLAVLALLLGAQSIAFAHELGHVDSGETSLCAVCSIGTGLDAPVHVEHMAPDTGPVIQKADSRLVLISPKVIETPLTARGPPTTS